MGFSCDTGHAMEFCDCHDWLFFFFLPITWVIQSSLACKNNNGGGGGWRQRVSGGRPWLFFCWWIFPESLDRVKRHFFRAGALSLFEEKKEKMGEKERKERRRREKERKKRKKRWDLIRFPEFIFRLPIASYRLSQPIDIFPPPPSEAPFCLIFVGTCCRYVATIPCELTMW